MVEELIGDALSKFGGDTFRFAMSLIIVGIVLILVNIATHAFIESQRRRADSLLTVERALRPALAAAADLVSRLSEMLITHQGKMAKVIAAYDLKTAVETRIPVLTPLTMNRLETTAFRLVRFLAATQLFRRDTADVPSFKMTEEVEYFLDHKVPIGLKGNLYENSLLSSEVQEEIGSTLLPFGAEGRRIDVGALCERVRVDPYSVQLFAKVIEVLHVDVQPLLDSATIDRGSASWRRILTLAHLGVYIIDFFQYFEYNCQWEEQRLAFVKLIKQWNADSNKERYLYEPGDISTNNYLDTFPGQIVPVSELRHAGGRFLELVRLRRSVERWRKARYLNARGARFRRRHDLKKITKKGVSIRTRDGWRSLQWTDDLNTLLRIVREVLRFRSAPAG